eukprot:3169579-Prymnesium_polylepis.1
MCDGWARLDAVLASRQGEVGALLQGCWAEAAAGPMIHLLWACRARAASAPVARRGARPAGRPP